MRPGIQLTNSLSWESIAKAGFSYVEIPFESWKNNAWEMKKNGGLEISGWTCLLESLTKGKLQEVLSAVKTHGGDYLVLETAGCKEDRFLSLIEECHDDIIAGGVTILLENGMLGDDANGYIHGPYSEGKRLADLVKEGHRICGEDRIGVCFNVGYANLLSQNLRTQLSYCRHCLYMVHFNDNDGFRNDKQMPYTFTKGRGDLTTDWYGIIGQLIRMHFSGWAIFDTTGLFYRCPIELHENALALLRQIICTWEEELAFEEKVLAQPGRQRILFGAGKMAENYMDEFGEKYPPAFLVDNGEHRWGETFHDLPICSPEKILEVPEEERTVLICCAFYDEIGRQLQEMGVSYHEYMDHYYL